MSLANEAHRIRSFVCREGRMTSGQTQAFEAAWPTYGIEPTPHEQLHLPTLFNNTAPCILEIGFGDGAALAQMAKAHPQQNYLGVEVYRPGIGALSQYLLNDNLSNVRIFYGDVVTLLQTHLMPTSLAGIHIFFPDPWSKRRHHKRRLIQSPFVPLLFDAIIPQGYLHIATDWEHYAHKIIETMNQSHTLFTRQNAKTEGRMRSERPQTKFERRAHRLEHQVWDLVYQRHAL